MLKIEMINAMLMRMRMMWHVMVMVMLVLMKVFNQHNQLNCLFQIMYSYQMFNGARKTPLHASFGHYQYSKCRSREVLTVANVLLCQLAIMM